MLKILHVVAMYLPLQLPAQIQGVDRVNSLEALLPKMKDDSNKVNVINDISYTYKSIDPDKGLMRGEEGRKLAVMLKYRKGEAAAYNSLGSNYWAKNDYLAQEKCFLKALIINEELNDKIEIAHTLRNIGDVYETQHNYSKAMKYYESALNIAQDINSFDQILKFQANIANVYDKQKKYPEALAYFEKSITMCEKSPDGTIATAGYLRRAGLVISKQGNYKKAIEYEKRALLINESMVNSNPYKDHLAWTLRDLGTVYFQQGDYEQSLVNFKKAFDQFFNLSDKFSKNNAGITMAKMGKSYLYIAMKTPQKSPVYYTQLHNSISTLNRAIEMLKPNDWTSLTEFLPDLTTAYQLAGNYKASLNAYQQYTTYKDSLYNTELEKEVLVHDMEYDYNRQKDSLTQTNLLAVGRLNYLMQQKELERLKAKQQIIYTIFIFAAICLIAFYFLYRNHLAKMQLQSELAKERIEKQLQVAEHERNISHTTLTALISQMNPHFIFNALNTIQSFIYTNDKKNASNYLGKFSELTRKILDNSSKKAVSLYEEMALLQLYLDIEKVRFGENFIATIKIDPLLDQEDIYFPPMLVQPYVENAIKNGLLHKLGNKLLLIAIQGFDENKIKIVIDDNGIGRKRSMEINIQKLGHQSFANAANDKRIALINQTLDDKIILQIIDKSNHDGSAAGTTVIIIIPIMKDSLT